MRTSIWLRSAILPQEFVGLIHSIGELFTVSVDIMSVKSAKCQPVFAQRRNWAIKCG